MLSNILQQLYGLHFDILFYINEISSESEDEQ